MRNALKTAIFASLLLLPAAVGCVRRDLYVEKDTPLEVIVNMNWTELGTVPEGATIYFYPEGGGAPRTFRTNSVTRTVVSVPAGYYTVMTFNRSESEYGTMTFHGMDALGTAGVTFLDKKVSWIDSRQDTVGRVVQDPERIVTGRTDHFLVRNLIDRKTAENEKRTSTDILPGTNSTEVDSVDVYNRKVLYTCYVNVDVKGVQNIKSVRAYLNGMADGAYLAARASSDSLSAYTMESWSLKRSSEDYTLGTVGTYFDCMGLPQRYLARRQPSNNNLVVQFLLVDNKTIVTKSFEVGDVIVQDDDQLTCTINIDMTDDPLPDVKPEGGSESGFDVSIDDWGDSQDIVVPM